MRKGDLPKWVYTFVLLGATLAWAWFAVNIVAATLASPTSLGVLETSGASTLLGALIAWNANVNQFWFRKAAPKEEPPETTAPSG